MSPTLSAAQRALLQQLLQLRQHELERRVARRGGGVGRSQQAHTAMQRDGDDAPHHEADREVDLALADREAAELAAVSEALTRVHDADFGQCIDCGVAIPFERLKLEPWARRCVGCQARREGGRSPAMPRASL